MVYIIKLAHQKIHGEQRSHILTKSIPSIHKWLQVTKESSAQGKHRREKCRRDDGCVEKRHMTGWTVRKVSQGRKEGSLPIHLPEF